MLVFISYVQFSFWLLIGGRSLTEVLCATNSTVQSDQNYRNQEVLRPGGVQTYVHRDGERQQPVWAL